MTSSIRDGARRESARAGLDPRMPVLVGVGESAGSDEPFRLMTEALLAAVDDAGSRTLTGSIDRLAVPQGSWSYSDPGRLVADAVGATRARTHLVELGIPQQGLVNDALLAIVEGRSDVAVVVGGEAKRWARRPEATETAQFAEPDEFHRRPGPLLEPVEIATGLWSPVQQYAMIDNALRAAEHLSISAHRRQVADLWERFNGVATGNPRAAFPAPLTASEIDRPTPGNRPLAFPYNKWHSTQWTVDQAAALVLCSVGAARRLGVPRDRWLFPSVGLESSHAVSLLARAEPHRWPAMAILGRAAAERIGRPLAEVEVVEVYSCFPAAVRVQQRELDLDLEGTPTITGGMAFAGGPYNNFVLQATSAVAKALREAAESRHETLGAVTTVSGLLTKPGLGIWSTHPHVEMPLVADLGAAAAQATATAEVVPALDGYNGPARVVTYTVTADGVDPARTVVLCDTADGRRCVAFSDDRELAVFAEVTELARLPVHVEGGEFHLR